MYVQIHQFNEKVGLVELSCAVRKYAFNKEGIRSASFNFVMKGNFGGNLTTFVLWLFGI